MRIGNLVLHDGLIMAPMAGITDGPFRQLVREMGCCLVFTEMISAEGLIRKKESLLRIGKNEHPVFVQLFGSNPKTLAQAAGMAEATGADGIDINMGCPATQVVDAGAGVELMRFPLKIGVILAQVRNAIGLPLTIKIRSGWDKDQINAAEISRMAEDCGVDAISIHPRTRAQGFRGRADWNLIKEVKQTVTIPVIGNGDVTTPPLATKMLAETGCDGVMIGRGALGKPWIFDPKWSETLDGKSVEITSLEEREKVIKHHYFLLQEHYGSERATIEIRKHLFWYTRGLPLSASFRSSLGGLREKEGLFEALASYLGRIGGKSTCRSFE
jgi:tRNA-dihydrouridine synthase B